MRAFVLTMLCKCKMFGTKCAFGRRLWSVEDPTLFSPFVNNVNTLICPHIVMNPLAILLLDAVIIARFDCLRLLLRPACMKYYNRKLFFNNEQYKCWEKKFQPVRGAIAPISPMDPPLRLDRSPFFFIRSILSKLEVSRKRLYMDYIYPGCMSYIVKYVLWKFNRRTNAIRY